MIKEMQIHFYYHTLQRYELLAPNVYPDWKLGEMDLMGIHKSGFVDEIEIKLSRSDFLADFKKTVKIDDTNGEYWWSTEDRLKHETLPEGLNHCNYFSFLMPEELAEKCDIPKYAGLYTFKDGRIKEVKKAPRLHSRKISIELKYSIAKKMAYRYWDLLGIE